MREGGVIGGGGEKQERERGDVFLCWTERPVDFFLLLAASFGLNKNVNI